MKKSFVTLDWRRWALLTVPVLLGALACGSAQAATFTVTNVGDGADLTVGDGACATSSMNCTLRAAIQEANATAGSDGIRFNISGADVKTITPATALPLITDTLIVDGYTQPGAAQNTSLTASNAKIKIVLDGSALTDNVSYGLILVAADCVVRGLAIGNFTIGISADHDRAFGPRAVIEGCFLGTDATGEIRAENRYGFLATSVGGHRIGGLTPAARNVISGNFVAIELLNAAGDSTIQGNLIGLDARGENVISNFVGVSSQGGLVGGTQPGARNVISGGIQAAVQTDRGISVQGNYLGTNATATKALGGGSVLLLDGGGGVVGGPDPAARNIICGGVGLGDGGGGLVQNNYFGTDPTGTIAIGSGGVGGSDGGGHRVLDNLIVGGGIGFRSDSGGNVIQGNKIGTDVTGMHALGSGGIDLESRSNGNTVGGDQPGQGNIIVASSGNGILIADSTNNVIMGNYIGVAADGKTPLPNAGNGIQIADFEAKRNRIGGLTFGSRNVIAGNRDNGIYISCGGDDTNTSNKVQGNYIGVAADGKTAVPNGANGILIESAVTDIIGGLEAGAGNVISGNGGDGVRLALLNTGLPEFIKVQGNFIGVDASGTRPLGNARAGVAIGADSEQLADYRPKANVIGGIEAKAGNIIAYNAVGVSALGGIGTRLNGNSIFANNGPGIDLKNDGVTLNDSGDGDEGPNNLQNFPVLTGVNGNVLSGTFNSSPNAQFRIELFSNKAAEQSSYGEGQTFLGFKDVTTDAQGFAAFSFTSSNIATASYFSATATDADGNTSEFAKTLFISKLPALSIDDVQIIEGNSGNQLAVFHASLSFASAQKVTVQYATGTPGSNAATPGVDYTALPPTVLTFASGQTSKIIAVPIIGDIIDENDEKILVTLYSPIGATIADKEGFCTIVDDDAPPTLSITGQTVVEGNSGQVPVTFNVRLSAPSGKTVMVRYKSNNVTAISGSDYIEVPQATLTFAPGETTRQITTQAKGDTVVELNERFEMGLGGPVNATIVRGSAFGIIINDDGPSLSIDNATAIDEGNSGTRSQTFTVHLSAASPNTVTVSWATENNTANSADYVTATSVLTFAPGETTQTITVQIKGDTTVEPNETYRVNLSDPAYAILADSQAVGYIRNDDTAPLLGADEPSE